MEKRLRLGITFLLINGLEKKIKNDINELLNKKGFINEDLYNVKQVKKVFQDHLNGKNHYMFLWQYINCHLWYESIENRAFN